MTHSKRKNWLNYLALPEPEQNRKLTERYVVATCNKCIHRLEGISKPSDVMLTKIVKMIVTIIKFFNDMPQVGPH